MSENNATTAPTDTPSWLYKVANDPNCTDNERFAAKILWNMIRAELGNPQPCVVCGAISKSPCGLNNANPCPSRNSTEVQGEQG